MVRLGVYNSEIVYADIRQIEHNAIGVENVDKVLFYGGTNGKENIADCASLNRTHVK